MAGEFGCLVVFARKQPRPMQRHWDYDVASGDHAVAGAQHPAGHHRRQIGTIAIFQAENEVAHDAVVNRGGTQPVENRRVGDRLGAEDPSAEIMRKRAAQDLAIGPLDEPDTGPAGGTKAAMRANRKRSVISCPPIP